MIALTEHPVQGEHQAEDREKGGCGEAGSQSSHLTSAPQVQATVVGLLAAVAALLLGAVSRQELDLVKAEVLCASSVITAFLAAFALGELPPESSGSCLGSALATHPLPRPMAITPRTCVPLRALAEI